MREWFIELANELMPVPERRPSADEVAETRIARHRRLEQARWQLLKETHREPTVTQIFDRAWMLDDVKDAWSEAYGTDSEA